MDLLAHNRQAWDENVKRGNQWTIPVTPTAIAQARIGKWEIVLTPTKSVPRDWFPESLVGTHILCLASGGGQQGSILAAAGANVTVFDNSPRQLEQDQVVAEREGLEIKTVLGDMADLSGFEDETFDLIVHPVSNVFVPDVQEVWYEAYRVLRSGGQLLAGFTNPAMYLFDFNLIESHRILQVVNKIPYSDLESLSAKEKQYYIKEKLAFEFSHTLDEQIGGQIATGFVITGFYEDRFPPEEDLLSQYMAVFIATRGLKVKTPL